MVRSTDWQPSQSIDWNPSTRRRLAVASLIGHCEAIAKAGFLPEPSEESLRILIAEALSAFGMSHHSQEVA